MMYIFISFPQIHLQVAQLYYEHHKLDYCEDHCLKILKLDENHTSTTMVLSLFAFLESVFQTDRI